MSTDSAWNGDTPFDDDTRAEIRSLIDGYLESVRSRHALTIDDDIEITTTANLETQELFVKLTGKTPYGNAYLAEVLERMKEER